MALTRRYSRRQAGVPSQSSDEQNNSTRRYSRCRSAPLSFVSLGDMSVLRCCIVVFLVLLSRAVTASPPLRYRLSILDQAVQKRFVVSLISLDDLPMCLHRQSWPNQFGHLHYGAHWATLRTDNGTCPAYDENHGRCVGPECLLHIAPHATLKGFISYEMFGHPSIIARLPGRRLQLSVSPQLCEYRLRPDPNRLTMRWSERRTALR